MPWDKSILLRGFQKQIVVPRGVTLQFLLQKHELTISAIPSEGDVVVPALCGLRGAGDGFAWPRTSCRRIPPRDGRLSSNPLRLSPLLRVVRRPRYRSDKATSCSTLASGKPRHSHRSRLTKASPWCSPDA